MNTATRVYGKRYAARKTNVVRFSWKSFYVGALVFVVFASALGVIYVKDLNRRLFIRDQVIQGQVQRLAVEKNKLLLEEGAWSTQRRIQRLAQQSLKMMMPSLRNIVFVEIKRSVTANNTDPA